MLNKKSFDLIVNLETGGQEYYDKFLLHPTVPGEDSGITIGVGFDLGYSTKSDLDKWVNYLSTDDVNDLQGAIGLKKQHAKEYLPKVKHIKVPFFQATEYFKNYTLPKYENMTRSWLGPNFGTLPMDCQGALVSLVFNRGSSTIGDRRKEMMFIDEAIHQKKYPIIPSYIRDMKRLWNPTSGLIKRRDLEAKLFEEGLA